MSLGENLQFLRKQQNMTQEQLAEMLNVSRQSVSKWESDGSFPETDKIIQICDMFHCSMDTLLRGSMEEVSVEDTARYDSHMNHFSIIMAFGIGLLIFGIAAQGLAEGIGVQEGIADMMVLIFAAVAIFLIVTGGIGHSIFCEKYPRMKQFYSESEIERFHRRFPFLVGGSITFMIIAAVINTGLEGVALPSGFTKDLYDGIFMAMIAVAVGTLVYAGIQKSKYDIKAYNRENKKEKSANSKKIGKWCAVIMLSATILFIVSIGVEIAGVNIKMDSWWKVINWRHSILAWSWVVFPIGGILCGIVSIILSKEDDTES